LKFDSSVVSLFLELKKKKASSFEDKTCMIRRFGAPLLPFPQLLDESIGCMYVATCTHIFHGHTVTTSRFHYLYRVVVSQQRVLSRKSPIAVHSSHLTGSCDSGLLRSCFFFVPEAIWLSEALQNSR
jgi:hypothetical protein